MHAAGFLSLADAAASFAIDALAAAGVRRATVVELGCGSGRTAARLAAAGHEVVGIDRSPEMLALARAAAPEARLVLGSVHETPIPTCDLVLAVGEVLGYRLPGEELSTTALLDRAAGALRPGGLLIFGVAAPGRGSGRRYVLGEGWAVLVDAREDPAAATLVRDIVVFRRIGEGWRRSDEVHRLALERPPDLAAHLRRRGLRARVLRGYGGEALGRGWRVIAARAPGRVRARAPGPRP